MTDYSFFHLTSHVPAPSDPFMEFLPFLTAAEYTAFAAASTQLYHALQDALDAYCEAHQETPMAVRLDAATCLIYILECAIVDAPAEA